MEDSGGFRFKGSRLFWTPFGPFDFLDVNPAAGDIGALIVNEGGQLVDICCARARYRLVAVGAPAEWTVTRVDVLPAKVEKVEAEAAAYRLTLSAERLKQQRMAEQQLKQREAELAQVMMGPQAPFFKSEAAFLARIKPAVAALADAPILVTFENVLEMARLPTSDLAPRDVAALRGVFEDVVKPAVEQERRELDERRRRTSAPTISPAELRAYESWDANGRPYTMADIANETRRDLRTKAMRDRRWTTNQIWFDESAKPSQPESKPVRRPAPVSIGGPRAYFED